MVPTLRHMAQIGMPLLVHGEVTDPSVDMFDREAVFIHTKLVRGGCLCVVKWRRDSAAQLCVDACVYGEVEARLSCTVVLAKLDPGSLYFLVCTLNLAIARKAGTYLPVSLHQLLLPRLNAQHNLFTRPDYSLAATVTGPSPFSQSSHGAYHDKGRSA